MGQSLSHFHCIADALASHGIRSKSLRPGTLRSTCPRCSAKRSKARQECLSITVEAGEALWFCHHCNWRGGVRAGEQQPHHPRAVPHTPPPGHDKGYHAFDSGKRAREIWNEALPITGTIAAIYLSIFYKQLPANLFQALRFHPRVWRRFDRQCRPALICALTDIHTNELKAIQRIYLKPDGSDRLRDADDNAKKPTLGPSKGTVCRLTPDEDVTTGISLAEGVEDGIFLLGEGWAPVWVTCGTTNLKSFPVLGGIEALTIWPDGDPPGLEAADAVYETWHRAKREVVITELDARFKDLGGVARGRNGR
jgi:hypothetical protein